jgi:hypothetical protein
MLKKPLAVGASLGLLMLGAAIPAGLPEAAALADQLFMIFKARMLC